jgi:hypothetical protein
VYGENLNTLPPATEIVLSEMLAWRPLTLARELLYQYMPVGVDVDVDNALGRDTVKLLETKLNALEDEPRRYTPYGRLQSTLTVEFTTLTVLLYIVGSLRPKQSVDTDEDTASDESLTLAHVRDSVFT